MFFINCPFIRNVKKIVLDLRIKSEPVPTPNSGEFPINTNTSNEWKTPDNGTTPSSPSNKSWNIDTSHKNVVTTLTADGNEICSYSLICNDNQ